MDLPASPFELVHPAGCLPFSGWDYEFAPYRWFYIRGFAEAFRQVQIAAVRNLQSTPSAQTLQQYRATGIRALPIGWRDVFPAGEWSFLSGPQIHSAVTSEPMRFDKVCLTILTLQACAEQIEKTKTIWKQLEIAPAIFKIDGFDELFWQRLQHRDGIINELRQAADQPHKNFFAQLAKGAPCTYRPLEQMLIVLGKEGLGSGLSIQQLHARRELRRGEAKSPNKLERVR